MTISVVLADDQPLVRMGLRVLIGSEDDLELVGVRPRTAGRRSSWSAGPGPTWS